MVKTDFSILETNTSHPDNRINKMCPICYNDEKPDNYTTPCGHSAHTRCLFEWWNVQMTTQRGCVSCPYCRRVLSNDEIEHVKLISLCNTLMKKMALGEENLKAWIEKVKPHTETTPMIKLVDAAEFVRQRQEL